MATDLKAQLVKLKKNQRSAKYIQVARVVDVSLVFRKLNV